MPERLTLRHDWLIENIRSAIEKYEVLILDTDKAMSRKQLENSLAEAEVALSEDRLGKDHFHR